MGTLLLAAVSGCLFGLLLGTAGSARSLFAGLVILLAIGSRQACQIR
jgi:hypothetical protein